MQAAAKQRAGRAGRVRPGMCFALYTRDRFESLRPFQVTAFPWRVSAELKPSGMRRKSNQTRDESVPT